MKNTQQFQTYILEWYKAKGRQHLPWRQTTDPYKILVSELMLQQTQVERVIPKYTAFLEKFPTANDLAQASLADVLRLWQGLGYNRRAKFLHATAQEVTGKLGGIFPSKLEELLKLPGIGSYTASAITTFAYNNPTMVIETNIRAVYLYHFFPERDKVPDTELVPLITATVYKQNPRVWYSALMDYGSVLKKLVINPTQKSKHYAKQSSFKDSPRRVRGEIIKQLTLNGPQSVDDIEQTIQGNKKYFLDALTQLEKEKLILRDNDTLKLYE